MVHKTKGIILRSVKYGETSLIVTAFTELFGLQSYLVNGVRTVSKKKVEICRYFIGGGIEMTEGILGEIKKFRICFGL